MRTESLFLLILLHGPLGVFAQYENEPDGFRGLTWNSHPPANFVLIDVRGELRQYENPNEDLSIGNFKLEEVSYFFHRNWGLVSGFVHLEFRQCLAFYNLVEMKFGSPTDGSTYKHDSYYSQSDWAGSKTNLTFIGGKEECLLSYRDQEYVLRSEIEAKKKEAEDLQDALDDL